MLNKIIIMIIIITIIIIIIIIINQIQYKYSKIKALIKARF